MWQLNKKCNICCAGLSLIVFVILTNYSIEYWNSLRHQIRPAEPTEVLSSCLRKNTGQMMAEAPQYLKKNLAGKIGGYRLGVQKYQEEKYEAAVRSEFCASEYLTALEKMDSYSFWNIEEPSKVSYLENECNRYFESIGSYPTNMLELHEACIRGNISLYDIKQLLYQNER
jgi:hypothetical protein